MSYLFMALAVFWVVRLAQTWVDAPTWMWSLVQLGLSFAVYLPWPSTGEWYAPFAIAGIVAFLQMAENLFIAKSDEALSTIIRRR